MNTDQRWLAKKYIAYRALTSMWFVGAIWLYFYRIFITDQQVGILDGMAFAIGLLAEIPSGALADKYGRDKIVKIGQLLAGGGLLIQAAGSSFMPFFVGQAIMMIGVAFVSGADDALFYDRLNYDKTSTNWRKLVTRGSQYALAGTFVATIAGGWLYTIEPRIPFILNGLAFLAAATLIWSITDIRPAKVKQKIWPEIKSYLVDIKSGFEQFILPKLWFYIPFIIAVQGLFYTTGYGLLRLVLLDRFYFDPFWGSVVVASCSLITVGLLAYMHKNADNLSEKKVLTSIAVIAAAGLLLSTANIGMWGYFVILALYAGEHLLHPFMSELLNKQAHKDQRATLLSIASFFKTLPYIFLAPIIGYLSTQNQLEYFLYGWTIIIVIAVSIYLVANKQDKHVSLPD